MSFVETVLMAGSTVIPAGGENRVAEAGMRTTFVFSKVIRVAVAVMPGRNRRSLLLTATTVV